MTANDEETVRGTTEATVCTGPWAELASSVEMANLCSKQNQPSSDPHPACRKEAVSEQRDPQKQKAVQTEPLHRC